MLWQNDSCGWRVKAIGADREVGWDCSLYVLLAGGRERRWDQQVGRLAHWRNHGLLCCLLRRQATARRGLWRSCLTTPLCVCAAAFQPSPTSRLQGDEHACLTIARSTCTLACWLIVGAGQPGQVPAGPIQGCARWLHGAETLKAGQRLQLNRLEWHACWKFKKVRIFRVQEEYRPPLPYLFVQSTCLYPDGDW